MVKIEAAFEDDGDGLDDLLLQASKNMSQH